MVDKYLGPLDIDWKVVDDKVLIMFSAKDADGTVYRLGGHLSGAAVHRLATSLLIASALVPA